MAQPRKRVLVITGDGDMLMSLGSLATVATQQPDNLAICVLDNEKFGETGNQATHTAPQKLLDHVAEQRAADSGSLQIGHCRQPRQVSTIVILHRKLIGYDLPIQFGHAEAGRHTRRLSQRVRRQR